MTLTKRINEILGREVYHDIYFDDVSDCWCCQDCDFGENGEYEEEPENEPICMKDPTLNDLLMALGKEFAFDGSGSLLVRRIDPDGREWYWQKTKLDLSLPLSQQTEEVKTKLLDLLKS